MTTRRLDPELLPQDFDPDYGVETPDGAALEDDLFGDLIGCDDIKLQLKKIRATFIHAERVGSDPREVRIFVSLTCNMLWEIDPTGNNQAIRGRVL